MGFKRLLKSLVNWLDRKFPDRVVVTQKDYDMLHARLKYLEAEVTKFNASLGFAGTLKANAVGTGQAGPFQR